MLTKRSVIFFALITITLSGCSNDFYISDKCNEGDTECRDGIIYHCVEFPYIDNFKDKYLNETSSHTVWIAQAHCLNGCDTSHEACLNCPYGLTPDGSCIDSPYCGDGECNGNETCNSCPKDCGKCECQIGEKHCHQDGKSILACQNNQWVTKETCNIGCHNNKCDTCSTNDAPRCINTKEIKSCQNHQWLTTTCDIGCHNNRCDECIIGTSKCSGHNRKRCINGAWTEYFCPNGCKNNECNECKTGEHKCDGNYAISCVDGKWSHTLYCSIGCENGFCLN